VQATLASGYDPLQIYYSEPSLRNVLDAVSGAMFSPDEPGRFRPIVDSLLAGGDYYLVLADFLSYASTQRSVEHAYRDGLSWARKALVNVAAMGRFSSDRTIRGYAKDVWGV